MPAVIPKGYVFIARDILRSTLWQRRPEDRIVALTSILLANHQKAIWHDGYRDVELERGQFAQSWEGLAKRCNLTVKTVRTSIERLGAQTTKFVVRTSKPYYSLFTVPNYGKYQDRDRYGREKELPEGAILVARKIMESSLWQMSAQDRVVGITCLLIANHSPGSQQMGTEDCHLERGQFLASWDRLARACRLSIEETQESMARLITSGFIVRDQFTSAVFTIPKYNHYQDPLKYSEAASRPFTEASQGLLFEEMESPEPLKRARSGQGAGSDRARSGQGAGKERATDKNIKNDKEWEEGGRTAPTPDLFALEPRGAPPPLPPGAERIADEYERCFPRIMGRKKAVHQAVLFLGRGGTAEEAVRAINEEKRPGTVIWKILDPLLEKQRDWRATFVPPKEWQNAESSQPNQA